MHSPKNCLPGNGWEIWQYDTRDIDVQGRKVRINVDQVSHDGERHLLLYWYQSKHRIIASEYLGKFLLLRDAVLDGDTSGAIVRIMMPSHPTAADEAIQFAKTMIPALHECFLGGAF